MVFKNEVKNISTAGHNATRMVFELKMMVKSFLEFYFDIQQAPSELLLTGFAKPASLADFLPLGRKDSHWISKQKVVIHAFMLMIWNELKRCQPTYVIKQV